MSEDSLSPEGGEEINEDLSSFEWEKEILAANALLLNALHDLAVAVRINTEILRSLAEQIAMMYPVGEA